MDRRQRKTRDAIFKAFIELLSEKNVNQITVGEIIARADIGRATFYAHFETKDFLIKELCEELFCHIFDSTDESRRDHQHIFHCEESSSVFLHLLKHLQKNDNHILELLSCPNNELFLLYFKEGLLKLVESQFELLGKQKAEDLPKDLWELHIANTFIETVTWWAKHKMKESPETIYKYFLMTLKITDLHFSAL